MPNRLSGWGLCCDDLAVGLIELRDREHLSAIAARERLRAEGITLPSSPNCEIESELVEKIDSWLERNQVRDAENEVWTTARIVRKLVAKNGSLV